MTRNKSIHLLMLYDKYYHNEVIATHLRVLKREGKVAFGKVKTKNQEKVTISKEQQEFEMEIMESLVKKVSAKKPLQLFLTDYVSLFVCKVIQVQKGLDLDSSPTNALAPDYYEKQALAVEWWFIIEDMRELVRNDFTQVRDIYFTGFNVLQDGRPYNVYHNNYSYPLFINIAVNRNYFESKRLDSNGKVCPYLHYYDIYKTKEQIQMRQTLLDYVFADKGYQLKFDMRMHPDTMDNLINAELEYQANKDNIKLLNTTIYNPTNLMLTYYRILELEIGKYLRRLLEIITPLNPKILEIDLRDAHKKFFDDATLPKEPSLRGYRSEWITLKDWFDRSNNVNNTRLDIMSLVFILEHSSIEGTLREWRKEIEKNSCAKDYTIAHTFVGHTIHQKLGSIDRIIEFACNELPRQIHRCWLNPLRTREIILGIGQKSILAEIDDEGYYLNILLDSVCRFIKGYE